MGDAQAQTQVQDQQLGPWQRGFKKIVTATNDRETFLYMFKE